ncbi:MAG TPA: beta-galactosidase, partial [Acidimicrobiales bacterium]|nr:beta-galactosidase [Acidimicrobiales bacterium]
TAPERDLIGFLKLAATMDLDCVFRPGPFITAEWRNGGIPQWLLDENPEIIARSSSGHAALGGGYPAVTYAHPVFRSEVEMWMSQLLPSVSAFTSANGGPIVNIQLDDEPSYFQKLIDPMSVDFNQTLVGLGVNGSPSLWALWLDTRYGGLNEISKRHGIQYMRLEEIEPPRINMSEKAQLPLYLDWLYFKLHQVNEFVAFLADLATTHVPGLPQSMLYPYLQPLLAGEFARFASERNIDLQLTNECYLSLNAPSGSGEHKVGHIVACHEVYNMWRRPSQGPQVTMELQSSNATYLSAGAMEMLYATTVARGVRGINYFMMVGGRNPAGYENDTGAYYDTSAPIGLDGSQRPNLDAVVKSNRVIRALEPVIMNSDVMYDTFIGCYEGYEAASMCGAAFAYDAWGHQVAFNMGDMGLSDSNGITSLFSLGSISFGCVDLASGSSWLQDSRISQLWVGALEFMPTSIQENLRTFAERGGHLVVLPVIPTLDEFGQPCEILAEAIYGDTYDNEVHKMIGYGGGWDDLSVVNAQGGVSMVAPGKLSHVNPPGGAQVIARDTFSDEPCAFTAPCGAGKISVLGFRLQYSPGADPAQHRFASWLVEEGGTKRAASSSDPPLVAMELAGESGGVLCVLNPVEIPVSAKITYTPPNDRSTRRELPVLLERIEMFSKGGRLLPLDLKLSDKCSIAYSTWELAEHPSRIAQSEGNDRNRFIVELIVPNHPNGISALGEVAIHGSIENITIARGDIERMVETGDGEITVVLASSESQVTLSFDL